MNPAAAITITQVSKIFGNPPVAFEALRAIDLRIDTGERVMLVGPSGSGKTTLLSVMGCVLRPTSGTVRLFDLDVTGLSDRDLPAVRAALIGFVFQGHNLLASLSARDNVALIARLRGVSRTTANREASDILSEVGLSAKLKRFPAELSGGERQRVAIARALIGTPPLILADEPTAALDAHAGQAVTELLLRLSRDHGSTVVIVTHDPRILHLADRLIAIEDGRLTGAPPA